MTNWEIVDEFIADTCDSVGDTFTVAELDRWAAEQGYRINAYSALQLHRMRPKARVFTTERVGMGPLAFHRVVSTGASVDGAAVARMHRQQAQEMVKRWGQEHRNRMQPAVARSRKAARALREAEASIKAVATLLSVKMDNLNGDGEDE